MRAPCPWSVLRRGARPARRRRAPPPSTAESLMCSLPCHRHAPPLTTTSCATLLVVPPASLAPYTTPNLRRTAARPDHCECSLVSARNRRSWRSCHLDPPTGRLPELWRTCGDGRWMARSQPLFCPDLKRRATMLRSQVERLHHACSSLSLSKVRQAEQLLDRPEQRIVIERRIYLRAGLNRRRDYE